MTTQESKLRSAIHLLRDDVHDRIGMLELADAFMLTDFLDAKIDQLLTRKVKTLTDQLEKAGRKFIARRNARKDQSQ